MQAPRRSLMKKEAKVKRGIGLVRFEGVLTRTGGRLHWVIVHVPFDAVRRWGVRGQIRVKGEVNGFGLRATLLPSGGGGHILLVNKKMQKGARAYAGDKAEFNLQLDNADSNITIPAELKPYLTQDRALARWYEKLNHSTRNYIAKWIEDPKTPEARVRRAEQIAERLLNVMEAELELPPILKVTFGQNPRARDGWEAMSPARRRQHLFGIFYYRTPDAQARRIEKMVEDATALAEKKRSRDD
jgi:uncharacterized protein YdeI (YjbR/CyaY-like superfamily)